MPLHDANIISSGSRQNGGYLGRFEALEKRIEDVLAVDPENVEHRIIVRVYGLFIVAKTEDIRRDETPEGQGPCCLQHRLQRDPPIYEGWFERPPLFLQNQVDGSSGGSVVAGCCRSKARGRKQARWKAFGLGIQCLILDEQ